MIYPDVSLKAWLERYPGLHVLEVKCLKCNGIILTERPFRTKDYVGLSAAECPHCNTPHKAYAAIPYSEEELAAWSWPS